MAHKEGAYSVDLGTRVAVSGGEDAKVKVWNRDNGDWMETLDHHDFIVWHVKMWVDLLVTCSYDCTMAFFHWNEALSQFSLQKHVKGHLAWADGLATDKRGQFLATHSEDTFEISIWKLVDGVPLENVTKPWSELDPSASFERKNGLSYTHELLAPSTILKGHTDEVNCVKISDAFVFSGGCDQSVRVWNINNGTCLTVLRGHEGKIWCLDVDRRRIVSGGRFGEILIWSWSPEDSQDECPSRTLRVQSKTTAVGQIKMDRALLVSADGLGKVVLSNFWNLEHS
ncbi:F-box and WD repeat domain-containing 11-B-like [Tigriopus californicus]|uniref:F-box and WD repeat domain-containing 11-B-like n=1 Tax=Tigriopus californicus TaxID=6832 RepID=UPI0027D9D43A|nr:F-box and WD repeat domain-containing 11-B-like [Tigriopus californicus]|eukprot:TCALIF_13542-PA protein Name:"Similar to Fbxw11 F-box/WD repeat-containing protein 11 (Mus musculus)" AED:0.17 eAED:0.17 QI:0/-1/0/1/-1/1/1/0/283